ncbi:dihydrolipoamide acetyltransferase family protein [Ureibacillus sp. FSL K6-8385]|uniref:Dihydrolipoamide acetyltransferase component of pyruvate dehydrogenase complex n=1 Tax=Ureibacillus terrenus TaxID=118246 RepID=A0A540V647_9BACL|nr:dihydrolipoamide acetyltransferase family protein [Ureibacillus terrenus]MED3660786.1 dihydrolipoamide acetyltransferase family protein [Ureibacillus terrenus]MED3762974.1 dihydrolipoamide acetyltransferase family protein [Ureibacillus terrenus]TQE92226.1 2-oxo acid dehydrogenase subunit E2 [Ureibacillus terrenus]
MTIEKVIMPQLGESVTEGTIEKWLVKPGDFVKKYDPIAEIISDKVNAEVPSSHTGIVKEIIGKEGETYPVGTVICTIEISEEKESNISEAIRNATKSDLKVKINEPDYGQLIPKQKSRYSPAVLKLASEHKIDLEKITGTGLNGRITRKDVLQYIESQKDMSPVSAGTTSKEIVQTQKEIVSSQPSTPIQIEKSAGDAEIPITAIRRAIANNMVRSKQEIPHAWMMMEVDVTNLVAYRDSIKKQFKEQEGFNITYFAFFVKAVAQALKEFPMLNSVWAGDKIIQKKDINISIAVATDDALYVPVIKHADEKSVKGIAREIHELSQRVRNGTLKSEHTQGGTFTVNNTGTFGSVQSMGIINYPQAAILQVEAIVKRPVIIDNMIAIRDMVNLCLSIDHRILDGFICGKFLKRVKDILENTNYYEKTVY